MSSFLNPIHHSFTTDKTVYRNIKTDEQTAISNTKNKTHSFSIIWFYLRYHIEIEINRKCYSLFLGRVEKIRDLDGFIHDVTSIPRRAFYRFVIKIDPKIIEKLESNLNSDAPDLPVDTCSGCVRYIINKYTKFNIPFLQSRLPGMLGYHLLNRAKVERTFITKLKHYASPDHQEINSGDQAKSLSGRFIVHTTDFGLLVLISAPIWAGISLGLRLTPKL